MSGCHDSYTIYLATLRNKFLPKFFPILFRASFLFCLGVFRVRFLTPGKAFLPAAASLGLAHFHALDSLALNFCHLGPRPNCLLLPYPFCLFFLMECPPYPFCLFFRTGSIPYPLCLFCLVPTILIPTILANFQVTNDHHSRLFIPFIVSNTSCSSTFSFAWRVGCHIYSLSLV